MVMCACVYTEVYIMVSVFIQKQLSQKSTSLTQSISLLQRLSFRLSLRPRRKKLKRLSSPIQLRLQNDNYTHKLRAEGEQYTDGEIVSSLSVCSAACVCV